jgi:hypothetical protein
MGGEEEREGRNTKNAGVQEEGVRGHAKPHEKRRLSQPDEKQHGQEESLPSSEDSWVFRLVCDGYYLVLGRETGRDMDEKNGNSAQKPKCTWSGS